MTHAMDPLVRLREQIVAKLNAAGLEAVRVVVAVGEEADGPHEVQISASLPESWARTEVDEQFEELIAGAHQAELDRKAEQTRQELEADLQRRMEGGEGILD